MVFRRFKAEARVGWVVASASALTAVFAMALAQGSPAPRTRTPTFTRDVAPILYQHCLRCHGAGQLAGNEFPMTTYAEARARDTKIRQIVLSRAMPPWPLDVAKSLPLRDDPRLSQKDIDTIAAWVAAGSPRGNEADLPTLPNDETHWSEVDGRGPDLVISLPGEMHLPAQGDLPYQRVLVKVPFEDDRWVVASETKPTNPAVVHHMALTEVAVANGMTAEQAERLARQLGVSSDAFIKPAVVAPMGQPDMLAIYTPGSGLERYEDDSAKLLRGGSNMYVIFNIHYQTTGTPQTDRSSIALWFAKAAPEHQLYRVNGASETVLANGRELLPDTPGEKAEGTNVAIPPIPPFDPDYELTGVTGYPEAVTIWGFHPHAHYRGKDFTYIVVYPDGREQTVLSVPRFHHHWQMAYQLVTPLHLPAGSKLVVVAHYDNSKEQDDNPAPEKPAYFRAMNQSWDEMFTPFIQYSVDRVDPRAGPAEDQGMTAALKAGAAVGCLTVDAGRWSLNRASMPVQSVTEATTREELRADAAAPLGRERVELLGARWFSPEKFAGEKVAAKGMLLGAEGSYRLNVTSLEEVGRCEP
jgi:mono/diheme cytochrome c family protein